MIVWQIDRYIGNGEAISPGNFVLHLFAWLFLNSTTTYSIFKEKGLEMSLCEQSYFCNYGEFERH